MTTKCKHVLLGARREPSGCRVQRSRCGAMQKMTSRCRWALRPTITCLGLGQNEGIALRPSGRRSSRSSARRSDHGRAVEGGPAGLEAARGVRPPARPPSINTGCGATVWRHGLSSGRPRACGGYVIADPHATYRPVSTPHSDVSCGSVPPPANHRRPSDDPPPPPRRLTHKQDPLPIR